jgi:hypothetical protein
MIRSNEQSDKAIDRMLKWVDKLRELVPHLKKESESECIERNIQILMSKWPVIRGYQKKR